VADIAAHKNQIFVGPLIDQSGTVRVPAGVVMDDATISGLQWLVQGVDGTLS
jgi:simple sugar transport system substrate-binding protein